MLRSSLFALVFAVAAVPVAAVAVPLQVAHQGDLSDASGPMTDTVSMTFELFATSSGGTAVWSEVRDIDVIDGHYAVLLGSAVQSNPIEEVLALEPALWLQVTVESDVLEPRQLLGSTPYAIIADTAINVDGGVVDASSISINGAEVINGSGGWVGAAGSVPWAAVTGAPADQDTLGGLSCADGFVAKYDFGSSLWVCDTDLVLSSGDVLGMVGGATLDLGAGSSMAGAELATADDLEWSSLGGVPLGFADDVDDDVLGDLGPLCADGDRGAWSTSAGDWECAPEEVELERLDTAGATSGQVLTFDGTDVAWEDPATASSPPCSLVAINEAAGGALLDCGTVPLRLFARREFVQVDAGYGGACGIDASGAASCWGEGIAAPPDGTFTQMAVDHSWGCGIDDGDELVCWGTNSSGQTASPSGTFTQVAVGQIHGCAINSGGTIECWGDNGDGQSSPPSGAFAAITAAGRHSCAINTANSIECWGWDSEGQASPPSGTFSEVAAGFYHTCALDTGGAVQCWGRNTSGEATPPAGTFTQLSMGSDFGCGIDTAGTLQCWGNNYWGQATPPSGTFVAVSAGTSFGCGILESIGTVQCWGKHTLGETNHP